MDIILGEEKEEENIFFGNKILEIFEIQKWISRGMDS
jgi:hypothetical protein